MTPDKSVVSDNTDYLFNRLTDLNNLNEAFLNCRKGVFWKASVQSYDAQRFRNIYKLKQSLINGTYKQKPFYEFYIHERGKVRHIHSMHISDRVLQRAICDYVLVPELSKYWIYDNGASVKGKGIEFSRKRIKTHLSKYYRKHGNTGYVLSIDFHNYFGSIPHDKLIDFVSEKIKDKKVMKLISDIVNSFDGDNGIGLGSQVSQVLGIYYLTLVDNYCKIRKGIQFYGRYMDDIYIIHEDKRFLKDLLVELECLSDEIGLELNTKKTQIHKIDKGFVFLKMNYILTNTGKIIVIPHHDTIHRERKKIVKLHNKGMSIDDAIEQYKGWRGNMTKFNCCKSLESMDYLFYETWLKEE